MESYPSLIELLGQALILNGTDNDSLGLIKFGV